MGRGEEIADEGDVACLVDHRAVGNATNAVSFANRTKAAALGGAVDQELYDRQNRLKGQLQEQEGLALQAARPQDRLMYAQALERLQADYQDLLLDIERHRPELLALVKVNPVSMAEIRQQLEPGVVLLACAWSSDSLVRVWPQPVA